jgi:hypothetical protein
VASITSHGGQLMIHTLPSALHDVRHLGRALGLLPATSAGGEVLLLQTGNPQVFTGRRWSKAVAYVALSQLALDSLGGTGRMPAEGEAVIEFMREHEDQWRLTDLSQWASEPGQSSRLPGGDSGQP